MPTKQKRPAPKGERKAPHENEVQPSRDADAAVGLGEGLEGAPIEEYEEELELSTKKAADKNGA